MEMKPWHTIVLLIIGYAVGYYWRTAGDMTFAKILPTI